MAQILHGSATTRLLCRSGAVASRMMPCSIIPNQGSQYVSEQFQRLMADNGITCSMSRYGNVWDNAAMESFSSALKTERMARKTFPPVTNHAPPFDYVECFYNPVQRHSTLGYLSPPDFRAAAHAFGSIFDKSYQFPCNSQTLAPNEGRDLIQNPQYF
jgi:hypothetical protein